MVISHFYCYSSYWQIRWQIYTPTPIPWYWHLLVKNGDFTFLLLDMKWQIYWQIYPQYWHLVVKIGDFTFVLLEMK